MGIVGAMSGTSLRDGPLVIRAGEPVPDGDVVVTPRIGITQAAEWPLRFFVRDDPYVSPTARILPADHLPTMNRFAPVVVALAMAACARAPRVSTLRSIALDEHPRSFPPRAPRVSRRVRDRHAQRHALADPRGRLRSRRPPSAGFKATEGNTDFPRLVESG